MTIPLLKPVIFSGLMLIALLSFRNEKISAVKLTPKGIAVVELFTSESCSSCPAAEKALAEYVDMENVYVLEFHVDYWNHLHWRDKYSSAEYTQRQRNYAASLSLSSVYTPQAVVNGQYEFVGSDKTSLSSYINKELNKKFIPMPPIEIVVGGNNINITSTSRMEGLVLNIALVKKRADTEVKAGENKGRKLNHHNTVTSFATASMHKGIKVSLPVPAGNNKNEFLLIAYLQKENNKEIVSAAKYELP